ncbi:MAG: hypothetical protein SFW36_11895 [Leptolyngbyaceae cyanobacterium bins.59]|nr:hypothetical protein [Leptolyngbyaceae cyanobacterium bins.59]
MTGKAYAQEVNPPLRTGLEDGFEAGSSQAFSHRADADERVAAPVAMARSKALSGSAIDLTGTTGPLYPQNTLPLSSTEADPVVPDLVAQLSPAELQRIQNRLRRYQEISNFGNVFQGSPAATIAVPTGYGADDNTVFAGVSFQSRTRRTQKSDAGAVFGVGVGDALRAVGVELSYTLASFGTGGRPFGTGGFNLKIHRAFEGEFAAAIGWNGFVTISDEFGDFKDSFYGVVTKVVRLQDNISDPFSRVALTAGLGTGQFRSETDFVRRVNSVNLFGSIAFRVANPVSAIVEWTGQDLAVGVSVVPISGIAWSITPALRDLTGAGDGTRFVIGTTFAVKF